ncbi:uncharacterized protein SPPG_04629 [Spizellomyces punctatus DAOM BR117]|uniref:Mitochondrial zinc maintenance protein 1, mitochondrial n=1 Tax=Spizellomyces punctatus (strain DAOM BR117) TaxID=645134 RepID=A0A0L0HHK2_SPIPD|nr:uncharacterized protein SPPG_04629 [Spizellomyces punctatus DAOM BR117]KND00304.1 hypothetical protein SPPG_04629 [Spizellomyces punctatus DAOM BR117]|eukprot:XP_016608343.1 hypothetical protein SPPG_04629 [Spizellomyces punctatus DAOM BR117]
MSAPMRSQVLRAYKDLLKAQRKTFDADAAQIKNARLYTRQQFLQQKDETDPEKLAKLVKTAQQAAVIIRKNIVQGVKKEKADETYVLKLDEEKEINSNDTIKLAGQRQPAQRTGNAPQRCCSA